MEKEKFPGKVPELPCKHTKAAAEEARKDTERPLEVLMWTDRFRLDSGRTKAGVAWRQLQEWRT